jgi:hypothetical protein
MSSTETTDYIRIVMSSNSPNFPVIAVVGHLVKDEIKTLDGKTCVSLGGTAYNLAALSAIQKTGRIYPVCRLGIDVKALSEKLFGSSPLFDFDGVIYSRRPNAAHLLTCRVDGGRDEWNSGKQSPLALGSALEKCDAILLNFISGSDVKLSELHSFRKRYKGLIYCDYHSLSLGFDSNKRRFLRHHPRWRDYLAAVDIIQMNQNELATIIGKALDSRGAVIDAFSMLHEAGPRIAIITAGRDGAILSQRPEGRIYHVAGIPVSKEIDPTGCGDTLSATFLYQYLTLGNPIKALEIANQHAAAKATFSGIEGFVKLNDILTRFGPPRNAEKLLAFPL